MIHEIGRELLAQLQTRGVPFDVIDGPEKRETTTYARERIVIEHDPAGDTIETRHLANKNARTYFTRLIGVKVTIFAKSPSRSAIYWEHIRRAEQVLDQVLVCLYWVATIRKNRIAFKSGKFVEPEDLKASETPGGAKYELLFVIDRGVTDVTWAGAAQPTATVSPQMIGGPALTFAATGHTITRSYGSWLLDGFAVGMTVIVTGSASNNGTIGPITALTDTVMTFGSGLVNEGPVNAMVTGNGVLIASQDTASGFTQSGGPSTETY